MTGVTSTVGTVALRYADHGWPVLPLHTPAGPDCSCSRGLDCGSPGKHPRTRTGVHEASTDLDQVREWWSRWPDANVGIATGRRSGLLVLDIDLPHGPASIERLQDRLGQLPSTCEQRTGSGGRQLLFAHPQVAIGNRARIVAGVDVRGDGGYIVAPPSRHASGQHYEWTGITAAAPTPDWLVALLQRDRHHEPRRSETQPITIESRHGMTAYAGAALRDELARLAGAVEGTRNDSLNRAAFNLGQLVGAGALDRGEVIDHLHQVATELGLSHQEARQTIASGLDAGVARPRVMKPASATEGRSVAPPQRVRVLRRR